LKITVLNGRKRGAFIVGGAFRDVLVVWNRSKMHGSTIVLLSLGVPEKNRNGHFSNAKLCNFSH